MLRYLSAEMQKMKRTFSLKLLWIAPVAPLICAYSGGQVSGFYFWYAAFLPGALTIMSSLVMLKDSKMKYRGVFSLPVDKSKIWLGKEFACGFLLLLSCAVFMLLVGIFSFIPRYKPYNLSFAQMLAASALLFVTFLWQVPLCLFLSAEFGIFVTVILNMFLNIFGAAGFGNAQMWAFPYAAPVCAMGPVLHLLPNGLKAEKGSFFLNGGYILPEVLISIALFIVLTALTAAWFRRQEAK